MRTDNRLLAFLWPCLHKLEFLLVPGVGVETGGPRLAFSWPGPEWLTSLLYLPTRASDFCRKLARQELELKYKAFTLTVAWVPKVTGMEALPPWPPGSGKGFPDTTEPYGNTLLS